MEPQSHSISSSPRIEFSAGCENGASLTDKDVEGNMSEPAKRILNLVPPTAAPASPSPHGGVANQDAPSPGESPDVVFIVDADGQILIGGPTRFLGYYHHSGLEQPFVLRVGPGKRAFLVSE